MPNAPATPVVLTLSGSDPSGGAGLQADLKTFTRHGVFGASAVSLITVQNTVGVDAVELLDPALVVAQARAVLDDLPVAVVKTGSLGSGAIVSAVAALLEGRSLPLVVDPVLVSKHGAALAGDDAVAAYRERLLPLATVATPNRHELERLVPGAADLESAAAELIADGTDWALITDGGGQEPRVVDRLRGRDGQGEDFERPRIATRSTHGTGCTLSAALAARLALGEPLQTAARRATAFLARAIASAPGLGRGVGPVDFQAPLDGPSA
ncbi:MAG: bifunctional hydroxymethylpyrimidine kinase/phosphomethylpyrimidine kinase [Planctomycetota bacterium]